MWPSEAPEAPREVFGGCVWISRSFIPSFPPPPFPSLFLLRSLPGEGPLRPSGSRRSLPRVRWPGGPLRAPERPCPCHAEREERGRSGCPAPGADGGGYPGMPSLAGPHVPCCTVEGRVGRFQSYSNISPPFTDRCSRWTLFPNNWAALK